jgi:hypothetical protein
VTSANAHENRSVTTDSQGAYELRDLSTGLYNVRASKGGYVSLTYGQRRPFEAGKPLQIVNTQTFEKVDFALPRGAVIAGRVVDEYGDAVPDVQVTPMRYVYGHGRRYLTPAGRTSITNDIGEFRLFALPPGLYYVSALLRSSMNIETGDQLGYAQTYFPGTNDLAQAEKVTVGLGQTVDDVNIALVAARVSRISGVAVDADGNRTTGGVVTVLRRSGQTAFGITTAQISADGSFEVSNVSPGQYILQAAQLESTDVEPEYASLQVAVVNDDVTQVRLVGAKPVSVMGRVVFDNALTKTPPASSIQLVLAPLGLGNNTPVGSSHRRVNGDLSFELKAWPGTFAVRLTNAVSGWSIKSVRLRGADVTDTGIELRPTENVERLTVELTNRLTTISGQVTNERAEIVTDYSVLVFARDREMWSESSRYFAMARPDQHGQFRIEALPPGDYYAIAIDYVDPGDARDPQFLNNILGRATTVRIGEGETKVLTLKMQLGS